MYENVKNGYREFDHSGTLSPEQKTPEETRDT